MLTLGPRWLAQSTRTSYLFSHPQKNTLSNYCFSSTPLPNTVTGAQHSNTFSLPCCPTCTAEIKTNFNLTTQIEEKCKCLDCKAFLPTHTVIKFGINQSYSTKDQDDNNNKNPLKNQNLIDYFKLFEIEKKFLGLDFLKLKKSYHLWQQIVHPDFIQQNSSLSFSSNLSLKFMKDWSALINHAKEILSGDLARAEYLIQLDGGIQLANETDSLKDMDLLMEIMEAREQLEAAKTRQELESIQLSNQNLYSPTGYHRPSRTQPNQPFFNDPNQNMNLSLKRPRSPSPYFAHLSADRNDRLDSGEVPLVRSVEALEAQLCDIESLARQVESRGDQIEDGRLIRLNHHHVSNQEDSSHHQAWVDRYDARLLLSPPPFSSTNTNLEPQITSPPPLSPTGFSDLPSDHEEMYYFKPNERLEIAQKKLRRRRDDERSHRIKMREEEDKLLEEELRLSKIPPTEQINLMTRTLEALKSSPSPSLLEIRILTNHGNDPRFSSFLRKDGKWSSYWDSMKANQSDQQVQNLESSPSKESFEKSHNAPSAGLVDYDDSSSENEQEQENDIKTEKKLIEISSEVLEPSDSKKLSSSTTDNLPDPSLSSNKNPCNNPSNTTKNDLTTTDLLDSLSDQSILHSLYPNSVQHASADDVHSVEKLLRQQRAKLWAEKRIRKKEEFKP